MDSALAVHRLHFAFTVTYHYIFPQLTMGLAPLIVFFKTMAIRHGDERYHRAARFWARIFGINFAVGVLTGIPMEFQFGTNWATFSHQAGGVIGQTLAMEGMFAFFLESTFLGLFLFGEKRLSQWAHWWAGVLLCAGAWLSGYFIVATNAFMQHPQGYTRAADGTFQLDSFWSLLLNPWAIWQYFHTMSGAMITGAFVMSAVGAFYLLRHSHQDMGRLFVHTGVIAGLIFTLLQLFPTGDMQGQMVARHQPATLAAMEALFETKPGSPVIILGQPNMVEKKIDNAIEVPGALGFLTYRRWGAEVRGLDQFKPEDLPDNIPLLYYGYHIMVGLGTLFIATTFIGTFLLWRRRLFNARWMLWILMLAFPFPYIANTAGWMTAEIGRQPWLIYGLYRTSEGASQMVSAGNAWFSLLGFMGMYTVLSVLFVFLIGREIAKGPDPAQSVEPLLPVDVEQEIEALVR